MLQNEVLVVAAECLCTIMYCPIHLHLPPAHLAGCNYPLRVATGQLHF